MENPKSFVARSHIHGSNVVGEPGKFIRRTVSTSFEVPRENGQLEAEI